MTKPVKAEDLGDYEPAQILPKGQAWTILGCAPNMERRVAETLNDNGLRAYVPIETYNPTAPRHRLAPKVKPIRTRPLIPGYIFAEITDEAGLDLARANRAVRLMCRHGVPLTIPAIEIGYLVLLEAFGFYDITEKPKLPKKSRKRGRKGKAIHQSRYKGGERIKIAQGVFAGFHATIERATHEDAVEVTVSIFGRESRTTITEAMIEWTDEHDI